MLIVRSLSLSLFISLSRPRYAPLLPALSVMEVLHAFVIGLTWLDTPCDVGAVCRFPGHYSVTWLVRIVACSRVIMLSCPSDVFVPAIAVLPITQLFHYKCNNAPAWSAMVRLCVPLRDLKARAVTLILHQPATARILVLTATMGGAVCFRQHPPCAKRRARKGRGNAHHHADGDRRILRGG